MEVEEAGGDRESMVLFTAGLFEACAQTAIYSDGKNLVSGIPDERRVVGTFLAAEKLKTVPMGYILSLWGQIVDAADDVTTMTM